ncbi:IS5 family transposase [Streptomyces sp. NPDC055025]
MWARIEPLMLADPERGRRWANYRRTLEAIAWKYRTCSPWRDLPEELGPFQTAHKRLIRWGRGRHMGTDPRGGPRSGGCRGRLGLDSLGRLHRLPCSPAFGRSQEKGAPGRSEPEDHALGRSCGGLSTKVHLASDRRARPLSIHVTAGQAGDAPAFEAVMAGIRVPRSGLGRPRTCPAVVLADRAYSSRAIRGHLRRRGVRAVIPQPADQIGSRLLRGRAGGRPPGFDAEAYKERNAVEWCIARLKQWRGLAMRADKLAMAYQAALHLAAILIWVRR